MSERPIQVGDLVAYRRVCCDTFTDGIWIFRVGVLHDVRPAGCKCSGCGRLIPSGLNAAEFAKFPGAPLSWLKRIPPLSELEGERTQEKLKEPA